MTLSEAYNVLHLDEGSNDELVSSLVESAENYLTVTTGANADNLVNEPLAKTAMSFLITEWYYADHADDKKLTRVIDSLLKALTLKVRNYE